MKADKALVLPPFERPDGMPTHEFIHRRLRRAIMTGAVRPGVALTIRGIAEAMQASPTPVREALRRLSSEGALQVLDNRRIVVPTMTAERFEELVALRTVLEAHAGRRAIPFITERQIDAIAGMDLAIDAAIADGDRALAQSRNQQFHRMIYTANPDALAMPMVESIWLQLGPFMGIAMAHVQSLYVVDRHREILDALRKRDGEALAGAIESDIREGIGGFNRAAIERLLALAGQP